jgi:two-component system LytT family response regulator
VTAYSEYAIKAFEISALDYILKPVESDALIHAIGKLKEKKTLHNVSQRLALLKESYQSDEFSKIALPVSDGLLFVEVKNIVCVEASGSYTNVWLEDGSKILVSKKILFFEKVLTSKRTFFRVHRSYIVNFNFVQKYNKAESCLNMDNDIIVPIPKEKKAEIENILKDIRIG